MKKYMKPVMASESFVANEFIGSCWTVTCNTCGAWEEGYDQLASGVQTQSILGGLYEGSVFQNSLENAGPGKENGEPCTTFTVEDDPIYLWEVKNWDDFWEWLIYKIYGGNSESVTIHKDVSKVENWTHTTNHPNASV